MDCAKDKSNTANCSDYLVTEAATNNELKSLTADGILPYL